MKEKDHKEFISLVRRMRQAQEAYIDSLNKEDINEIDLCQIEVLWLEREVDEYLKKMEK